MFKLPVAQAFAPVLLLVVTFTGCNPTTTSPLIVEPGICADTTNLIQIASPAQVNESAVTTVLYVDPANPAASDTGTGSQTQPYRTISAATARAVRNNTSNIGTKVSIAPGTYREAISLNVAQNAPAAPLVFEAAETGKTIISGADIFHDWQPAATPNTYTSIWPYQWGLAPYPAGWQGSVVLQPITRRREMVFVNDVPYKQVLTKAELTDSSFYVAEDEALLYLKTPAGFDLKPATVEVSTRPILFHAQGKTNLVLRGLTFIRGNRPVPDSSAEILDSHNVLVEDCQFRWNNWDGFQISTSNDVTVLRSVADNNGAAGFGAYQLKNVVYSDNETSFNNWRGAMGGFYGWAVAGSKFGNLHGAVVRNHHSEHNQTRGFWFDYDDSQILIDNANWSNNYGDGLFIEANEGPILIRNSTFSQNANGAGISGASSSDVTVAQNIISGNEQSQIQITGDFDRPVTNFETNVTYTLRAERWTFSCNSIASASKSQALVDVPNWLHFLTTVKSQKDAWFTAGNPTPFKIGGLTFSYGDWLSATK